mmetsp:Transcript_7853/g.14796  ORF Transcript_7853/g.14796 Transcript_7853/m.14796 type:complete len:488 (-) Transcript_7853:779-2242(-)|eukprot:CAMPEP_0176480284 /NCGR_PEP_ID=MMETSP0200_2-20121128/2195_1 /TAXON_ID=947934 /ORGANISM="Chaetoceros sp., Strain GSL56" /LENGTH=487 /DNA_ID=CAMNT_0017876393 /DNA_START=694 /DNA_END=2157 /DNA_ORIENTATION=+
MTGRVDDVIVSVHNKKKADEKQPFLIPDHGTTNEESSPKQPCRATMRSSIYVAVPANLTACLHKKDNETGMHKILKGSNDFNSSRTTSIARNNVENTTGKAAFILNELDDSRPNSSLIRSFKKHRPTACYSIIILRICIFLVMVSTQGFESFSRNPFIGPSAQSINMYGAKNPEKIRHGEIWRALTAIFQTVGILDLFFSSGMLLCFGASVEARWGSAKWLFVYLASGICGNLYSSFLVEPIVVSVGDGGSILGLLGFVHIEMISSIILSASTRRDQHRHQAKYSNKDGTSSRQHTMHPSIELPYQQHHKKRSGTLLPAVVLLKNHHHQQEEFKCHDDEEEQQQQQGQEIEEQERDEQERMEDDDDYFLHSAVIAIGMFIGIIVTLTVEWILHHVRLVATRHEEHSDYYPPAGASSRHHQYYMKKDWSVLYGGLMTGILCGCIWNICKLNHDTDRRTIDRVRVFYALTLVTIPMLMVGVYSIKNCAK